MKAELIDNMGSDLTVVNAARVSFAKASDWNIDTSCGEIRFEIKPQDEKLIKYLAEHQHWTPFSHCTSTFRIKAPIFVARQLFKHKVGLTENEISRRYVDGLPELYYPKEWRKKANNKKQGSSTETVEYIYPEISKVTKIDQVVAHSCGEAIATYIMLLDSGVCPEQARMVLPQNMYTEWYWTGSLYAFSRVCNLRLQPDAQEETSYIAEQISQQMLKLYPVSWIALIK